MNPVPELLDGLFQARHPAVMAVLGAAVLCFFIQMWYLLGAYARIPGFRLRRRAAKQEGENPDISVIVVLQDDYDYLEKTLPKLMAQNYDNYEVVIVSMGSSENFDDELLMYRERFINLVTTRLEQDPRFPISNKMAINVGIKASGNDHIVLTTSDSHPTSDKWLGLMAKGFAGNSVVLGYAGLEPLKGMDNMIQRCARFMISVRFLSSAIRGVPYRGLLQNMGFTKKAYFAAKGFNHLNMNIGEDDLFVQSIANGGNTGIVMNPHATVRQMSWEGMRWWRSRRLFLGFTYRYYPLSVKVFITAELVSRALFFLCALASPALFPRRIAAGVMALVLLRLAALLIVNGSICRRLGDKGIVWASALYDITAPFGELALALRRSFGKVNGVWR